MKVEYKLRVETEKNYLEKKYLLKELIQKEVFEKLEIIRRSQ